MSKHAVSDEQILDWVTKFGKDWQGIAAISNGLIKPNTAQKRWSSKLRFTPEGKAALQEHQNKLSQSGLTPQTGDLKPASVGDITNGLLVLIRAGPQDIETLADTLDVPPKLVRAALAELEDRGVSLNLSQGLVSSTKEPQPILEPATIEWSGQVLRFCSIADTHLGSRYEQLGPLNAVYDECEKRGIRDVYHSGDLCDGEKMYRGHVYEIHVHGADAQREYAIEMYPSRPGIRTHMVAGNHDWSFYKTSGFDVVASVCKERKDLAYHGPIVRKLDLVCKSRTRRVFRLELRHPRGGSAYARSYKLQKIAESYAGGEKPDMSLVGHWHHQCHLFIRNIHMVQLPCLQSQTPYEKELALDPVVGAYFWEVEFSKAGDVGRVIPELMTWYVPEPIAKSPAPYVLTTGA